MITVQPNYCYPQGSPEALAQRIKYLEDAIIGWASQGEAGATQRLWALAIRIIDHRGLERQASDPAPASDTSNLHEK